MLWPERNKEIWDDWWGTLSSPWSTDLLPKLVTLTFLHFKSQNNMFFKCTNAVTLSDLHATVYKAMLLQQEHSFLWWLHSSFIFSLPWLKSFTSEHWRYTGKMIAQGPGKSGVFHHMNRYLLWQRVRGIWGISHCWPPAFYLIYSVQNLDWPSFESAQSLIWC